MLEKALESPLDSKKIKPVNPEGNKPWIFIERTDAEAEAPIFCPSDVKNRLLGKDPDAGKDWRQEEKKATKDKMTVKLYGIIDSVDVSLRKLWEIVKDRKTWSAAVHGVTKKSDTTEQMNNKKWSKWVQFLSNVACASL